MFADDSSTIVTDKNQIWITRECIHTYKKGEVSKSHKIKKVMMPIWKARSEKINHVSTKTNFKLMVDTETETCLGDVIGNTVVEETIFEKSLEAIEKLEEKLKPNLTKPKWNILAELK